VERGDRAPVATFYAPDLGEPGRLSLERSAAHHASVRRLHEGDPVRVTNGAGTIGSATIERLSKGDLLVSVEHLRRTPRLPPLELLPPVADRERMLWLAEKCAELAISIWQPVIFVRSRSVSPRGEGAAFQEKVRSRMIAALEQSGGAWLPEVRGELPLADAAERVAAPARYVLDRDGNRFDASKWSTGAAVAFGPEGGLESAERARLIDAGWEPVSLGPTTLRFETAGIAAVAILRAPVGPTYAED